MFLGRRLRIPGATQRAPLSLRGGSITLALAILFVAATAFTYLLSLSDGFNPPDWVRGLGLLGLPIGLDTNEPGRLWRKERQDRGAFASTWYDKAMDLMDALERLFPFARRVDIVVGPSVNGSFVAELVLPVRHGATEVQLYRFPCSDVSALEETLRWPDRMSTANGAWAWLVAWDGVASRDEVRELVAKRVIRHPVIGDASN